MSDQRLFEIHLCLLSPSFTVFVTYGMLTNMNSVFGVLCFVLVATPGNLGNLFTHIIQGCFTGTWEISNRMSAKE